MQPRTKQEYDVNYHPDLAVAVFQFRQAKKWPMKIIADKLRTDLQTYRKFERTAVAFPDLIDKIRRLLKGSGFLP